MRDDDLIGSTEVCEILGIDKATLSRWVNHREPKLTPVTKFPGPRGAYVFRRADVEALRIERAAS